jgi:hypothetical protein
MVHAPVAMDTETLEACASSRSGVAVDRIDLLRMCGRDLLRFVHKGGKSRCVLMRVCGDVGQLGEQMTEDGRRI